MTSKRTATTADVLIERLIDWGVRVVFGLPGDGINGIMEALARAAGPHLVRPGAARRGRGVHGVRLREIHRSARRLPRDVRAGRDSSAERPLRREDGRRAGARHHRPDLSRSHRHALSAGSRSARRSSRTSRSSTSRCSAPATSARSSTPAAAPRCRCAASRTSRCPVDLQEQPVERRQAVGEEGRRAHVGRVAAADRRALRRGHARRRRRPERRHEDGHPRRPGRARRRRRARATRGSAGRADRQAAARQGGRARRLAVHDRRHRPARHRAVRSRDGRVRHAADGRHELSVHGVLPEARPLPRRADRPRSVAHRPALSGRSRPVRRREGARCRC